MMGKRLLILAIIFMATINSYVNGQNKSFYKKEVKRLTTEERVYHKELNKYDSLLNVHFKLFYKHKSIKKKRVDIKNTNVYLKKINTALFHYQDAIFGIDDYKLYDSKKIEEIKKFYENIYKSTKAKELKLKTDTLNMSNS